MTLLSIILIGIMTAFVMALGGDYSGLKMIGTILIYIVIGGFFVWFLAVTGWIGLVLILIIYLTVAACSGKKE